MIDQIRLLGRGLFIPQPDNRGQERLRRAGLTGITAMLSHGLVIATGLISVPLTINYLGQERYGVWLTINSLLNWLAVANLGFSGNALINSLAEANGKDDRELERELVATAFWSLIGLAVLLSVVFAVIFPMISWPAVFNVTSSVSLGELHWAVILSLAGFVLMFPLNITGTIYQGYQAGYIGNVWSMAGSILSLMALVGVTRFQGGLIHLVLAMFGVRILVLLVNLGYLFCWQYPWLRPLPSAATRRSFRRLLSLGSKYLVAQVAGIGMFHSQPMIIAQVLGPVQVGIFNVAQRLLTLPLLMIQLFAFPLLSAYGEAHARQDWSWIRRTFWRSLIISTLVGVVLAVGLAAFVVPIIRVWAGPAMVPEPGLITWLTVYVLVAVVATPASVMLYGLERVGGQAVAALINALGTILLGIWFTRAWGLSGTAAAMALSLAAVNLTVQFIMVRSALRAMASQQPSERTVQQYGFNFDVETRLH
ncbi:MAG: oligosaccharide flippase family protein [Acidobacteriota bacterium]|nr:oligosaccharide flippase family protein [Blastocatellia bacterium]MDW8240509.1 oligosaccharide flippase family protein [Acidobacteriota bacterium]